MPHREGKADLREVRVTSLLAITALCIVPPELTVREHVDCIEANSFYSEKGELVFDQAIFYDWCNCGERFSVRAWRMVKVPSMWPERDWDRGGYSMLWIDGDVLREVRAHSYRRTWTQRDPELIDREWLPRERRKELTRRGAER